MTVMIGQVYDARKSAGADEDKARRAAEAVAEPTGALIALAAGAFPRCLFV